MRIGTQLTDCYRGGGCIYSEKSDPGKICNVTMYVVSRKMTQKSAPNVLRLSRSAEGLYGPFYVFLAGEGGGEKGKGKKMVISTSSESPASLQY